MSLQRRVVAGGNVFGAWTVEDTGTVGVGSTYLYKLANNIISTDVTRDAASGAYSVTIEHVEDTQALQTFIESAQNVGAGAIEDLLLEDGTNETGSAQNKKLIVAVRGGLVGGGNETNTAARKVGVFPQRLSNESGGYTQAGETYNRVTLSFEGFKLQSAITLSSGYFGDFMTSASAVTLFTTIPYGTVVYK
jgi:hypothetical protein